MITTEETCEISLYYKNGVIPSTAELGNNVRTTYNLTS